MIALLEIEAHARAGHLPVGRPSRKESDEDYGSVVAQLNVRWRVIACRDDIQWIVQFGKSTGTGTRKDWRGRGYFRRREALIRACAKSAGPIEPAALAILEALPKMIAIGGTQ